PARAGAGGSLATAAGDSAASPAGAPEAAPPVVNKNPHADPNFQAMKGKAQAAGGGAKAHSPAAAGAAAAQAAAVGPANDVQSQAAAAQVDEMSTKQPGAFDRAAFIQAVKQAVDASTPKNLEEADEFKKGGAGQVAGQVSGLVKDGKQESEKDIKDATAAAPDASKGQAKPVQPMASEPVGEKAATVGAQGAMPPPTPAAATDLSAGPDSVDAKMAEAEVTDEQLQKSNEPDFKQALTARDAAKEHSAQAPQDFRKDEKDVLGKAKGDAATAEGAGLQGMQGARGKAFAQVRSHKQGAKSDDEAKRAKVATDIQGIYERTKGDVQKTLDGLDGKVDAAFSQGEGAARKKFEDYVGARMDAYKEDRYGGLGGGALWLKDKLLGMPDEVNRFYAEGKTRYLKDMDGVIGKVADVVGAGLTAARARIAQGQAEIKKYVAQLPQDLQKVGKEAEEKLSGQFEQLSADVDSKQSELIDTLAKKYVESRDALDARIDEMKAANRGLVDKAMEAVAGVVKTILQLKNMLMGVLAKAADVIGDIIADPIGFLGKLVDGVKAGLQRFVGNIANHLQKGLMGWLFGALGDAGIQLPKSFDLKGILDLVLQVLGLTYRNIRARVVKLVGEPMVARLESTVEVFKTLVTEGPAGLWKWIMKKVGDLEELVLGQIKDFIIEKVIKAGITWLIAFLNPAAAFIKACKAIYDIVMFLLERGSEIMNFVRSILDSVGAIAKGNIGIVAEKVESSLSKALPLAISFLASLLGLGGISEKIRSVIQKVQAPINKAVDFVVMGAVKGAKKLFGGAMNWAKGKVKAGKDWVKGKAQSVKDRLKGKPGKVEGEGDDPRSADQKQQALEAAAEEVNALAKQPDAKRADIEAALPAIKERHALKSLKLFDEKGETRVEATINPRLERPIPLAPEDAEALMAKLVTLRAPGGQRFSEKEADLIVRQLAKSSGGTAVAGHIMSGRFDGFSGYTKVVSKCKVSTDIDAALMALHRADAILSGTPGARLIFEDTQDKVAPKHDVDLGVVDPNGRYSVIYQFGHATGSGNIASKATKGAAQLAPVTATRKIVEVLVFGKAAPEERGGQMVIDDGSKAYFDAHGFDRGLSDWPGRNPGMELHVTFATGETIIYPK
ncbi:phage tail protein, partial [Solirubrobacter deserti]